jgi:ribosome biogenesis GTPase A
MQYKRNYSDSGKKGKYIFLFLLFFVLGKSETVSAQKKEKWKLVWKDEFNYTGVPKASKWGYELGHIRNSEQQYYTARKENVWVNNGVLTITGRKENYPNEFF